MRSIALCVLLVACERAGESPRRAVIPRRTVTEYLQPDLPHRGVLWNLSGLGSTGPVTYQAVIDVDAKMAKLTRPELHDPVIHSLTDGEVTALWREAAIVWSARKADTGDVSDYSEHLVIVDGDDAFELKASGPVHGSPAATLIGELSQMTQEPVKPR